MMYWFNDAWKDEWFYSKETIINHEQSLAKGLKTTEKWSEDRPEFGMEKKDSKWMYRKNERGIK